MMRIVLLLMLSIPCLAGPSDGDVKAAISAQNKKAAKALVDGDARAFADLFTEDGFVMSPNVPVIRGRDQIFRDRRAILDQVKVLTADLATISIDRNGAIAWEIGRFTYEFKDGQGNKRIVRGNYLALWEQQPDGVWKMKGDVGLPDSQ